MRNWATNKWDVIDNYVQPASDTENVYLDIKNPNDYIRPNNNRILIQILTKVKVNQLPGGFTTNIDHVQIDLTS